MSREFKFRCWNEYGKCFHGMDELPEKLHLFSNKNQSYVIEQFTGLKDKNGVDIYEGDILALENEAERSGYYTYKVVYVEEKAKFMCKSVCVGEMNDMIIVLNHYDHAGEYAVIGSIHQNPELIK